MKLGTIKIEALKLMFANNDDELTIDNRDNGAGGSAALDLNEASIDPQYRDYLNNMNGAINRCYSILEARKVLPTKRVVLLAEGNAFAQANAEFSLSSITDIDDIKRVTLRNQNGYMPSADYYTEGDTLVLPLLPADCAVALIYYPTLPRLTQTADNTQEIPVPDKIAAIIPYYVKYDLFREDSESEANTALRRFEETLSEITERAETYQSSVDSVVGYWGD